MGYQKVHKPRPATAELAPDVTTQLTLTPSKKGGKALKNAAEEREKVKVSVTATATDDLGASTEETETAKLKPKKPK